MGKKAIAVAVIHGIGNQEKPNGRTLTFSSPMHQKLARKLGKNVLDNEIAWKEVYWADFFQPKQQSYLDEILKIHKWSIWHWLRRFVVYNLADASGYVVSAHRTGQNDRGAYWKTQQALESAFADLDRDTVDDAPLVIVAHSMGGQIFSDYLYDTQNKEKVEREGFLAARTLAAFVTIGCNIPVFTLSLEESDKHVPPQFPGKRWREGEPWWFNFWSKNDPLGFPLNELAIVGRPVVDQKDLCEKRVCSGLFPVCLTPLSHQYYWSQRQVVSRVETILNALLQKPPVIDREPPEKPGPAIS